MPGRVNRPARVLSLFDVLAMTALLLFIFVLPTYATGGASLSSQTGTIIETTGSATIFEANPQAFSAVMGIVVLSGVTLVFTLVTAWLDWAAARWTLLALLVPLTGLTLLAVFSIGIVMAPLATIGWVVFAMRKPSADDAPPEHRAWT